MQPAPLIPDTCHATTSIQVVPPDRDAETLPLTAPHPANHTPTRPTTHYVPSLVHTDTDHPLNPPGHRKTARPPSSIPRRGYLHAHFIDDRQQGVEILYTPVNIDGEDATTRISFVKFLFKDSLLSWSPLMLKRSRAERKHHQLVDWRCLSFRPSLPCGHSPERKCSKLCQNASGAGLDI